MCQEKLPKFSEVFKSQISSHKMTVQQPCTSAGATIVVNMAVKPPHRPFTLSHIGAAVKIAREILTSPSFLHLLCIVTVDLHFQLVYRCCGRNTLIMVEERDVQEIGIL